MATSPAPTTIEEYITQLIEAKGLQNLPDDTLAQMKHDLIMQLNDTLIAKTIASLNEKDLDEFESLVGENPSDEQISEFIKTKIPDHTGFLASVFTDFRNTYLGTV